MTKQEMMTAAKNLRDKIGIYFDLNQQKKELETAVKSYRDEIVEKVPEGKHKLGEYEISVTVRTTMVWDTEALEQLLGARAMAFKKPSESKVLLVKKI